MKQSSVTCNWPN